MKITTPLLPAALVVVVSLAGAGLAEAASAHPAKLTPAQRLSRYEQRLSTAVNKGKLTPSQGQAILAEHTTLVAQLTGTTRAERKQERKIVRQEARTWAQQQHVPVRWLGFGLGRRPLA